MFCPQLRFFLTTILLFVDQFIFAQKIKPYQSNSNTKSTNTMFTVNKERYECLWGNRLSVGLKSQNFVLLSSVHSLRLITVSSSSFSVGIKALQKGWSQSFFAGAFVRPMTASFCSDSPLICYLFLSSRENKRFLAMINWIVNNFVLFLVLSWDLEAIFWWES